ncbi:MAG TPA: nuclear transport factor 2 family protein [Mycobacterium sp.]|nr:nuclear transport factor 2 family protein [Mycobacterium sp.]
MSTSEIATVLAWYDAVNSRDVETLEKVSSDDIEIGDAHGAVQGLTALHNWVQGLTDGVTVGRMYVHDGVVVAEQTLSDGTNDASAFRVVHDHVTSVFRHPDLASALAATDLTENDLDA